MLQQVLCTPRTNSNTYGEYQSNHYGRDANWTLGTSSQENVGSATQWTEHRRTRNRGGTAVTFERGDVFNEKDDSRVDGFFIIDTDESEGYRIAEKDTPPDGRESRWISYWVPEASLQDRTDSGACEKHTEASDEQIQSIERKV